MATTYAYQKGKYGGPCGTIFPFFRDFVGTNPQDEEYRAYVPAGFLRCRGQVLNANDYVELAEIIGIGDQCIYKKTDTNLENVGDDGTGGQIQLPDLGSKYIAAGSTPGAYNDLTLSTDDNVSKAGIEVALTSAGEEIVFSYDGDLEIPKHDLNVFGGWTATGSTVTSSATVSQGQILAHGHYANVTQTTSGSKPTCGYAWKYIKCWGGGFAGSGKWCNCNSNATEVREEIVGDVASIGLEVESLGSSTGTQHYHSNANPKITSQSTSGKMAKASFSGSPLTTTVALKTASTSKIDAMSPKFILCEYLIKI